MFLGIEGPIQMLIFSVVINGGIILFCLYKEYSLESTMGILIVVGMTLGIYSILFFIMLGMIVGIYFMMGKSIWLILKDWWNGLSGSAKDD